MRRLMAPVVTLLIAVMLPAAAAAQSGPASCSTSGQNLYVRQVLQDLYLWNEFLPAVNPTSFSSPEAYLEAVRYRPLDEHFSYITSAASSSAFYSDSQFIGYGFGTSVQGDELRVLQVYPDSPASEAGLARGDRILEIDGRSVVTLIATGQIGGAFGPSEIGYASEVLFRSVAGVERRERMSKRAVTIPTVSLTRAYDVDGRRVGYLFFRNFVRPSVDALNEAFLALREAGVTELVLDLRYNGGGLVDVAVHLSSLIGGALTAGQTFATFSHNSRNTFRNETLHFTEPAVPAPTLNRLFVITTRGSASASELVINGLRPFMPVVIIGDTTYGKPVGQYLIEFCSKVLAPVSFSLKNANGEAEYFDGLAPTCLAGDGIERELGDPQEASLSEAFHYIRHDGCSAAPAAASSRVGRALRDWRATGWQSLVNAY